MPASSLGKIRWSRLSALAPPTASHRIERHDQYRGRREPKARPPHHPATCGAAACHHSRQSEAHGRGVHPNKNLGASTTQANGRFATRRGQGGSFQPPLGAPGQRPGCAAAHWPIMAKCCQLGKVQALDQRLKARTQSYRPAGARTGCERCLRRAGTYRLFLTRHGEGQSLESLGTRAQHSAPRGKIVTAVNYPSHNKSH